MADELNSIPLKAAEKVYNSYLLLYKLNELKVDDGKSLQALISEATTQNKTQIEFKVNGKQYQVDITQEGKLKVLGEHAQPEVKEVLKYTNEDIIGLWANSEVSIEQDQNNNLAFVVGLRDEARLQDLKVGGLGKKVPFSLRFANFYKVIEILNKDGTIPLEEKLRLANNIATGSGKTGDIALLKFWAYLANIPCITMVPSDTLRTQSNKFDEEFLPDEVAIEFGESFSEENTRYATTTFKEALDIEWNVFNGKYGENRGEPALILIDEAPKLKENVVLMARSVEIARDNPTAFFSATPDAFLSEEFKIKQQILLSPKEREVLGIGKLPVVHYHKMKFKTLEEMSSAKAQGKSEYELRFVDPGKAYTEKIEKTHAKLNKYESATEKFKNEIKKQGRNFDLAKLSQPFLDFISQSLDSQAYKEGLIATEERWAEDVTRRAITNNDHIQDRKEKRIESFVKAIEGLNTGLTKSNIKSLVEQNLNVEVGGQLLPYIKLHNIIDTLNEYKKSDKAVDESGVSKFIEDTYGIVDSDNLKFNSKLTSAILKLERHQGYSECKRSVERNYPGDKKLYEHIFQHFPDIKEFCEQDAVIHYFNGSIKRFKSSGGEVYEYNNSGDIENIINMIKAGFVSNAISKELAMGIDAPRLSRAAAIIKDKTEMLDPMFLLQLMGRVGRDIQKKGLCYFDMFTSDKSYLKIDDITTLSGENLLRRLEESYGNYVKDEKGIVQAESEMLDYDLRINNIVFYALNPRFLPDNKSVFYMMQNRIKSEFNKVNTQYGYNQEICLRVFVEILKNTNSKLKLPLDCNDGSPSQANFFATFVLSTDKVQELKKLVQVIDNVITLLNSKQIESSTVQYSDNMSLEEWAHYIVHAKPMSYDDLVKADPNSKAPIFMEQKERSQQQNVSVHNVGNGGTLPSTKKTDHATQNNQPQQTSAKVMYGMMIASPFLAVGVYALVVGAAFDLVIAASIFIGVAVAALALFGAVKVYEKVEEKKSNDPKMSTFSALGEMFNPQCLTEVKSI